VSRYVVTGDRVPESDIDAIPKQAAWMRETSGDVTTSYERLSDDTELVTWEQSDGRSHAWRQRWTCGLDNAPSVGTYYRTTHDEWQEQEDGVMLRTIHAFEVAPS
jgi:hypothetical protein